MAGLVLPDLEISAPEICFLHYMLMALGGFTLPPKPESCTFTARDKFSTMSQRTQPHGAWPIFCKSYMITDWFRAVVDTASPARGKCSSSLSSEAWVHWWEQSSRKPSAAWPECGAGCTWHTGARAFSLSNTLDTWGCIFLLYYMKLPSSAHISMCG